MIKHEMENAFKLDVPLTVELGMGKDWLKVRNEKRTKTPTTFLSR
jgi:hypothetical protein